MKNFLFYNGLLFAILPLSPHSCSLSPTLSTAQAQRRQATLSTTFEKSRRIPRWQFDNLALLKLIKDSTTRLWGHHHPRKNIVRLED
jgi:hypothetical protein